ncbi:hypothetical protein NCC49_001580 [Naganishia albida]|nr:hypothetical protein NCC49_001580 [Naganishia albida]
MSASNFSSMLAKTKFATFDPLISRVYTSPSASRGDWGLKYTLPSSTAAHPRPKYLRILNLDAGRGLNCDYRSGEKEARFIERWADGRHGWLTREEHEFQQTDAIARRAYGVQQRHASGGVRLKRTSIKELKAEDQVAAASGFEKDNLLDASAPFMPDIEAMGEKRFRAYLEELRARRGEYARHLEKTASSGGNLLRAAVNPKRADKTHSRFIAESKMSSLKDRASNEIVPSPHDLFGLAYSKPVSGTSAYTDPSVIQRETNPLTAYPGRALPADTGKDAYHAKKELQARGGGGRFNRAEYVIGVGGLTAGMARGSDHGYSSEGLDTMFDHTRTDKTRGVSQFRIKSAALLNPPNVILSSASGRRDASPLNASTNGFISAAKQASPLDSFKYDMEVYATRQADAHRSQVNNDALVPGEPGWVGMNSRSTKSHGDQLASAGRPSVASLLRGRTAQTNETLRREIENIMSGMLTAKQNRRSAAAAGNPGPSRAAFSTSARASSNPTGKPASELPTADPSKALPQGDEISGPGFGEDKKSLDTDGHGSGLADGDWRQLEENVGGEVRYGEKEVGQSEKKVK